MRAYLQNLTTIRSETKWSFVKLSFFALFMALLLAFNYQQQRLDLLIYDVLLTEVNPPSLDNTVIVEVDDKSLILFGQWPWSRTLHADLLSYLTEAEVAAVGFDILFAQNNYSSEAEDAEFAQAIEKAGNVVLPIAPSKAHVAGQVEILPQASLAISAAKLGHVDFEFDIDGLIRKGYLYAGFGSARWPSFALALSQIARPNQKFIEPEQVSGNGWTRQHPVMINYSITPETNRLTHYSYADVLTREIPMDAFKGKVVLVGMNATAQGDQFPTPISIEHSTMPGVEINAHLVNSVMNNNQIQLIAPIYNKLVIVLLLLLTFALLILTNTKTILAGLMLSLLATALSSLALFYYQNIWFPPVLAFGLQIILFAFIDLAKKQNLARELTEIKTELTLDPATQLFNETGFIKQLDKEIVLNNKRYILLMQIGKFKGISSLFDDKASGQLLSEMRTRIEQAVAQTPLIFARLVGTEFALCMPSVERNEITQMAKRLVEILGKPYMINDEQYTLPVYIGMHELDGLAQHAKQYLNQTRTALKTSKDGYISSYCWYTLGLEQSVMKQTQLESDLAQALSRDQFEIYYQPQICTQTGKIVGAESLIRWNHHEQGLISPDQFIPLAESNGMIIDIGTWTLQQACAQAKVWQDAGHDDFRIADNLSALQFADNSLIKHVINALIQSQLNPKHLELELTETGIIDDMSKAADTLKQLKEIGVEVAIDDFGTGYASLSYLQQFPVDRIKIDRSFVDGIDQSTEAQMLTSAIITMAHKLDISVIAEGIETINQQHWLQQNNCEELQGYLFSRPLPAKQLTELLAEKVKLTKSIAL